MLEVKIKTKWNGNKIAKGIKKTMKQRLALCGERVSSEIRRRLSVGSPPRSVAGESPHSDTGRLRQATSYNVVSDTAVLIGSHTQYALPLELGTNKMAARPYLLKTVNDMKPTIQKILGAPIDISRVSK